MQLQSGLVFCSDSRTNAGPDQVNTYSKMHTFTTIPDRTVVILSAGNLATTQAVIGAIKRDLDEATSPNLSTASYMSEIADYIGELCLQTQEKYASTGQNAGFSPEASFIVGGQIAERDMGLSMIYPEGNHINASQHHPYLQIGEVKYGKPILERIVRADTDYQTAMRCALVSMNSTMRSNATVGPPIELLFYKKDRPGQLEHHISFAETDEYLLELGQAWDQQIVEAFNDLPPITPWLTLQDTQSD